MDHHDYKVCSKQLEYSSEICNQIGCRLNTKPLARCRFMYGSGMLECS